jgi:hypothetical protein
MIRVSIDTSDKTSFVGAEDAIKHLLMSSMEYTLRSYHGNY